MVAILEACDSAVSLSMFLLNTYVLGDRRRPVHIWAARFHQRQSLICTFWVSLGYRFGDRPGDGMQTVFTGSFCTYIHPNDNIGRYGLAILASHNPCGAWSHKLGPKAANIHRNGVISMIGRYRCWNQVTFPEQLTLLLHLLYSSQEFLPSAIPMRTITCTQGVALC